MVVCQQDKDDTSNPILTPHICFRVLFTVILKHSLQNGVRYYERCRDGAGLLV